MSDESRAQIVERVQSGHPQSIQLLMAEVGDDLVTYARALAGSDEARFAMLMEDFLVEIIRNIGQSLKTRSLSYFAVKAATGVVRRHHQWVFRETPSRRSRESDVSKLATFETPSHDEVCLAMQRLAPEERELLVLRHSLRFSIDDISDFTMRGAARLEEDLIDSRQRFRHALMSHRERYGSPLPAGAK